MPTNKSKLLFLALLLLGLLFTTSARADEECWNYYGAGGRIESSALLPDGNAGGLRQVCFATPSAAIDAYIANASVYDNSDSWPQFGYYFWYHHWRAPIPSADCVTKYGSQLQDVICATGTTSNTGAESTSPGQYLLVTRVSTKLVVNINRTGSPPPPCCPDPSPNPAVGNPIYPLLGTKREEVDLGIAAGKLRLKLVYDSAPGAPISGVNARPAVAKPLASGQLWSSTLHRRVLIQANGKGALVARGDGRTVHFSGDGSGTYTAEANNSDRLISVTGGYRYIDAAARAQESYDSAGKLLAIKWASGESVALSYSTAAIAGVAPAAGYLIGAQDNSGRNVTFAYQLPAGADPTAEGLLTSITDAQGRAVSLGYDGARNLTGMTWPDLKSRLFHYENTNTPAALTGISDELGVRYATFGYDSYGRAISTEYFGGVERYSVSYSSPPMISVWEEVQGVGTALEVTYRYHDWVAPQGTVITDPQGLSRAIDAATISGKTYLTSQSQPAGSGSAASGSAVSYDANGNRASRDDLSGNRSCYVNDQARNLQTTKVEGLASTVICGSVTAALSPLPDGSRKTTTLWHPDWPLVSRTAEPGKLTTYVYNGQPDPTASNTIVNCAPAAAPMPDGKPIAVLCKQVEQATTDANGSAGFGASLQAGVAARAASYTYDAAGRVLTSVDANGRSQTYAYYADTAFTGADPNAVGHTVGDLQSTANAAGHTTTFALYDKAGRVRQSVDPKGVTTDIAYAPRGWVSTVAVTPPGGTSRTTSYTYDNVGQMTGVSMPDGTALTYSYDTAHRLVGVTDARGNSVTYTLDNSGNRLAEEVKDPAGVLQRSVARSFDALSRVQQVTGAAR